jgi:hypothetical protein
VICICGPANNNGEEYGSGDRFEENVETAVKYRCYRSEVERQVWDSEPFWKRDDCGRVCPLLIVSVCEGSERG